VINKASILIYFDSLDISIQSRGSRCRDTFASFMKMFFLSATFAKKLILMSRNIIGRMKKCDVLSFGGTLQQCSPKILEMKPDYLLEQTID
jgi:hypothetical protein